MNFHKQSRVIQHSIQIAALFLAAVSSAYLGCSSRTNGASNASGQSGFDKGMAAIKEKDWQGAVESFNQVLSSGSIDGDQVGELYAYQALAYAKLGKFEESEAALENAKQGADLQLVERIAAQIQETKRPR